MLVQALVASYVFAGLCDEGKWPARAKAEPGDNELS